MSDTYGLTATKGPISMLDYPSVRMAEPRDCDVCGCVMPTGWYAASVEDVGHVCCASCLDRVVPDEVGIKWKGREIDPDEARDLIQSKRDEAEGLREEADELESQADDIEELLDAA